jgi:hypothetical protein
MLRRLADVDLSDFQILDRIGDHHRMWASMGKDRSQIARPVPRPVKHDRQHGKATIGAP